MANSYYTIKITDNNLSGNFLRVQVQPDGNIDKWSTTTFVVGSTSNYYECEIGSDIEQTIINLKTQLDNYYIGNGGSTPVYNTTIIATDTLKIELIAPYLAFVVSLENGLENNAVSNVVNSNNIKYQIEYNDVVNIKHVFEIYDPNHYEAPIQVNGTVTMDYGQVEENLEAFRGQGLRVDLDADSTLTYEDLFDAQQKVFSVIYYRDSTVLFRGWLNSEGFFEDFVNDKWVVSFDCIDGLGYLQNLAFVNSNGTNITGIKTQLEILSLALQRTGIQANINVDIDVFYTGLADTNSILANVNANTRRYIKDDDFTVMNCEEVIRDVLEPYGAVLTSYNGEWAIYKPNQLVSNTEAAFFRYDYLGTPLSPTTVTFEFGFTLGSQINNFYPHHCNGNQSFTNKPSFGAYRISYKYGLLKSLITNYELYTDNGVSYDGWTITDSSLLVIPQPNGFGVDVKYSPSTSLISSIKSFNITVENGTELSLGLGLSTVAIDLGGVNSYIKVLITDGVTTYRALQDGSWSTNLSSFIITNCPSSSSVTAEYIFSPAPIAGDVTVDVFASTEPANYDPNNLLHYSYIRLDNVGESNNSDIVGDVFTFERTNEPSARIEKTREVFTGDSNLDIYEGTLYKADGITPTETWYRKGVTEAVPILELMGSETMRMNQNTIRVFSGDVFGYFNYLSVITIDGRSGKFGVTKYSYDTYNNVISMEIRQLFSDELTDLSVEDAKDFGNVVEPTIRG